MTGVVATLGLVHKATENHLQVEVDWNSAECKLSRDKYDIKLQACRPIHAAGGGVGRHPR